MPEVVEERRGEGVLGVPRGERVGGAQRRRQGRHAVEEAGHHVGGPDGVGEARMFGAGEGQRRHAEGRHAPQPLGLGRVHQRGDHLFGGPFEGHQPVHRVTKDHGPVGVPQRDEKRNPRRAGGGVWYRARRWDVRAHR